MSKKQQNHLLFQQNLSNNNGNDFQIIITVSEFQFLFVSHKKTPLTYGKWLNLPEIKDTTTTIGFEKNLN